MTKRGFTLIELLVVIAIIGILASVVLASLNSARDKGEDAATKSNLNNIRAQAEIVYDDDSRSYAAVCSDTNVARAITEAGAACADTDAAWAAEAPLNADADGDGNVDYYCVDSTGNSTEVEGATTSAGTDDSDLVCG
ncbi:type II secretion system protein [Candidatus Kaiserbacteria bacterium]|nr:type II secretion system protein [Candidatus Kaiserbacteria bacterium]